MRRFWSDEDIKALRTLYPYYLSGEVSRDELTAIFDRTFTSIQQKASAIGTANTPVTGVDRNRMMEIKKRLKIDLDEYAQTVKGEVKCL